MSHGDKIRWAGLWRDGINAKSRLIVERSESDFKAEVATLKADGYTLIDVDARASGNGTVWAGVLLGGKLDFRFSPSQTWGDLAGLATERHKDGWSLVRVVPHEAGGELRHAGLWRRGEGANYYQRFSSWSDFWAESGKQFAAGIHLTDFQPYWKGNNLSVIGVWLAGPKGSVSPYVDREGLTGASRIHRGQGRRQRPSERVGGRLPVRRHEPGGRVIHIGWDWWSGNTIVVSHDVAGTTDAYRTIYMHLRNGPKTDAAAAWDLFDA